MATNETLQRRGAKLIQAFRLAAFLCLLLPPLTARGAGYDVSYLWSPDKASVAAYKAKIAGILGPDVARKLLLVRGPENYGLIYRRKGGLDSAKAVARSHTAILTARGLEPAACIPASDWAAPEKPAAAAPETTPAATSALEGGTASSLEADVENYIRQLRKRGQLRGDERTAWVIYDFTTDKKLVSINEDLPLEAASLIKPFIALAYFHEVEAGRKPYSAEVRGLMERMIQDSDNRATNWLLRRLGGPAAVQRLLKSNYGGLLNAVNLVEYIPAGGRTYRNKASAHDYSRFLYALWNDALPRAAEIKRLMNLPNRDRLYSSAPGVPQGTEVYDKTGTTSRLCGNMGILVARREDGARFPYIIVGVIERASSARRYSDWMWARGDVIRRISEMAYKEIAGLQPAAEETAEGAPARELKAAEASAQKDPRS